MKRTMSGLPDSLNWFHGPTFLSLTGLPDCRPLVTVRIYYPGQFSTRWYAQVTVQRNTWIEVDFCLRGFAAEESHWVMTDLTLLGKDCEQWEAAVEACLDVLVRLLWEEPSL